MASNNNVLVVFGATGQQGSAVLKYFAAPKEHGFKILRGISRDPNSASSRELSALGIEMVYGDLNDVSSLERALAHATHVFATTDSNRLIFDALKRPEILKEGQDARAYAQEIEYTQGQNISAVAASLASLQRLVWSSLPSPRKWSHGRYTRVTMFDTKENIADLLYANPGLKGKLSVLMPGFFATNALAVPKLYAPRKQQDGVYELALPMSGDVPVPHADLDVDIGRWVNALFQAEAGLNLVGSTQQLTWNEWLRLWAVHNKVPARYRQTTLEEFAGRMPGISDAVAEEFAFVNDFSFTGGNPSAIFPEDLRQKGIELPESTIASQIRRCDWTSLLR